MPDDELIAKARELVDATIYPYMKAAYVENDPNSVPRKTLLYFCAELTRLVPLLIDLAEKRGAMAIEERAKNIARRWDTEDGGLWYSKESIEIAKIQASLELSIESSQWRKIGPEDATKIKEIIEHCRLTGNPDTEVLRRLIGGDEKE